MEEEKRKAVRALLPFSRSLRTYFFLAWFLALRAVGNLSLAWGSKHFAENLAASPLPYLRAMSSPYIALGILLLMSSLLVRLALFSIADLSFVLLMTAVGYPISVCLGKAFLHEYVSGWRWLGVFMIVGAVFLVGSTPQNTTAGRGGEGQEDLSFESSSSKRGIGG